MLFPTWKSRIQHLQVVDGFNGTPRVVEASSLSTYSVKLLHQQTDHRCTCCSASSPSDDGLLQKEQVLTHRFTCQHLIEVGDVDEKAPEMDEAICQCGQVWIYLCSDPTGDRFTLAASLSVSAEVIREEYAAETQHSPLVISSLSQLDLKDKC